MNHKNTYLFTEYQDNYFIFFQRTFHRYFLEHRNNGRGWNWGLGDWLTYLNDVILFKNSKYFNKLVYIVHCYPTNYTQSYIQKIICTFIGEAFFCKHITIDYANNNVFYISNSHSIDCKTQKYLIKYSNKLKKNGLFHLPKSFAKSNNTLKLLNGFKQTHKIFVEWPELWDFDLIHHIHNAKMPKKQILNNIFLNCMLDKKNTELRENITDCIKRSFKNDCKHECYYPLLSPNFQIIPYNDMDNISMDLKDIFDKVLSAQYIIGPEGGIYHLACYTHKPYVMILPDNLLQIPVCDLKNIFSIMTNFHRDYCHIFIFENDLEKFFYESIAEIECAVITWPQKSNIYLNLKNNKFYNDFFIILKNCFI
tara:strand:+ start:2861 stop:3958 length:1098 start_codon:yes stop_codon:yes gene_type:complete